MSAVKKLPQCAWFPFYCSLVLSGLASARAQPPVDFGRDVQPILQQHCWKCHSEERAAGGLRLDERKFAEQGGGSGRNLLELAGTRNELLRRVKSTVDGERMPLEGPGLADEEIATLERWIAQGAIWPSQPAAKPAAEPWQERWLRRWEAAISPRYIGVWIAAIVILVLMLGLERLNARLQRRLSRAWHLVGLLCVALFAMVQYAREQTELRERQARNPLSSLAGEKGFSRQNEPFRPQHPRRLGGTYYRGNDERSAELFNGGFYRTATFQIHLTGAEGEPLEWGDALPEEPHLRFEIARSPHASPTLFAPNIMEQVALSAVQPEQLKSAGEFPYTLIEEQEKGERWSVLFPLAPIPAQGRLSGKVYVYSEARGGALNSPAYLIGYELAASEGTIAESSQIWMASVYNVSKLQWPEPGKIPADQWFDFRPIPEIEQP